MFKRNIEQELALYEADETGSYNGLILFMIINSFSKCTLDQLSYAFYLVRFTKVLSRLLNEIERERFLEYIPEWELRNLDSILSPYIIQKYDRRFVRGLKELLARSLVKIEGEFVSVALRAAIPLENDSFRIIRHKAVFACTVIRRYELSQLQTKIYQAIGEEQWENLYISTELR
ncbi:hypothetical protein [Paenibacillus medicaginis]|uniref:Uncharacterized protein n=1 Tax=Paenibacillus medicaginis TaxID=1470560 RepID=A0ABV5BV38_9BACL